MIPTIEYLKNSQKEIVLFGAGRNGEIICSICLLNNIPIRYVCDNHKGKVWNYLTVETDDKVEIVSLSDLDIPKDSIFIITTDRKIAIKEIRKELISYNYSEIYESIEFFNNLDVNVEDSIQAEIINAYKYQHYKKLNSKKLYIESLQVQITERCSLLCNECFNMMQHYKKPQNYPLENIIKEFDKIMETVDNVSRVSLVGGEPLVHPDLFKIIHHLCEKQNIYHVRIMTNGTICPKEEDIKTLDRTKVSFQISDYGKYSKNMDTLCSLLDKYKISYRVWNLMSWSKLECCEYQNLSEKELAYMFAHCYCVEFSAFMTLGRVFRCTRAVNMYNLEIIPHEKSDFLDLMNNDFDRDTLRKELNQYLYGRAYVNECQYCKGGDCTTLPVVPVAEQVKHILPYKKYD